MKVLHSICQQIWKTQQWPQDWKRSVFIKIPKTGNASESSNYHTIALISHVSKVMLKNFQARLQQYVNRELPDVWAGFRKGRGTRDLVKKIRETKGTFHAKMGLIKDRNGMDLTEAEDIKKRCKINRTIQKSFSWPWSSWCVITHLEPNILECKV